MMFGKEAMEKLASSCVAVFGLGGVGGHAAEALIRSGVGAIMLVDNDVVSPSNINRQLLATVDTVGRLKTDVAVERLKSINPSAKILAKNTFFMPENSNEFDFSSFDYVVDAIDTVTGKIELVLKCEQAGTPIISCMGAGNKTDPTMFEVADIYKTSVCPLARVMRRELKARGVKRLKVVYSREEAISPVCVLEKGVKAPPSSNAFVPSVAGLIAAGEVLKDLIGYKR